jgi:hypothetical protein
MVQRLENCVAEIATQHHIENEERTGDEVVQEGC